MQDTHVQIIQTEHRDRTPKYLYKYLQFVQNINRQEAEKNSSYAAEKHPQKDHSQYGHDEGQIISRRECKTEPTTCLYIVEHKPSERENVSLKIDMLL